jgi:hypothetical protein
MKYSNPSSGVEYDTVFDLNGEVGRTGALEDAMAGCDGGGDPVPGVSAVVIAVGCEFVGRLGNLLLRHRVSARASRRAFACPISQSGLAKSPCRGFATRVPRRCRANGSAPAFLLDADFATFAGRCFLLRRAAHVPG